MLRRPAKCNISLPCNIPTIMFPNTSEWLHHVGAPAPLPQQLEQISQGTHLAASPYRCTCQPSLPTPHFYFSVDLSCHTNAYSSTAPQLESGFPPFRGTCSNGEGEKKKPLPLPSLRPTRMEPPSYDSRVYGLTRLLGTLPPQ